MSTTTTEHAHDWRKGRDAEPWTCACGAELVEGNVLEPEDPLAALSVLVSRMSQHIDDHNRGKHPAHLLRIRAGKAVEELGEVEELLIELENSNPRKPSTRYAGIVRDELSVELLDVALAALGAVEHLYGNRGVAIARLDARARMVADRMGVDR